VSKYRHVLTIGVVCIAILCHGLTIQKVYALAESPRRLADGLSSFEIGSTLRPRSGQASSLQVGFDWVCFE